MVIHEQVSDSEGCDLFGWGKTALHERNEWLSECVVAGKRSFNLLCVGVRVIENLTGGAVCISEFSGTTGVWVSFILETSAMGTGIGTWEVGQNSGDG